MGATCRGFQGHGRGRLGGAGRGRGQVIYYNRGEAGRFGSNFQNPAHLSCQYCRQFNHVIEDCPVLIAKM